jgi:hypothetical protein
MRSPRPGDCAILSGVDEEDIAELIASAYEEERVEELISRACDEVDALGREPQDPLLHSLWVNERHDALLRLASHAEWKPSLCRSAAYETGNAAAQRLLLDAFEVIMRRASTL